jgi:CBS domain-containing protein
MERYESIKKYMTSRLITFSPETDIKEAIATILKNKISGAPVLSSEGELVGIISEKDCLRVLLDGEYYDSPSGHGIVSDYMSRNVKTVTIDKNVLDVASEFAHSHYRRFPVLENGKLVGQVSRRDILKAVGKIRPVEKVTPSSWVGREPK